MRKWVALTFLVFACNWCRLTNPFDLVLVVFKLDLQICYPWHHPSIWCGLHSDNRGDTCWTHTTILYVAQIHFRNRSSLSPGNSIHDTSILGPCNVQVVGRYNSFGLQVGDELWNLSRTDSRVYRTNVNSEQVWERFKKQVAWLLCQNQMRSGLCVLVEIVEPVNRVTQTEGLVRANENFTLVLIHTLALLFDFQVLLDVFADQ